MYIQSPISFLEKMESPAFNVISSRMFEIPTKSSSGVFLKMSVFLSNETFFENEMLFYMSF